MDLTDEQWAVVAPLIIRPPRRHDGRGRPRRDDRPILNAVLWILRTGAAWPDLPARYPPYTSCHHRFLEWLDNGTLERILSELARDIKERGQMDLSECFFDGTLVVARKGAAVWERPSEAKIRRSWQLQTALLLLSPATLSLLTRIKSPLLQTLSPRVLSSLADAPEPELHDYREIDQQGG